MSILFHYNNKKYVFIHNPKTAGTSIKNCIRKNFKYKDLVSDLVVKIEPTFEHISADQIKTHWIEATGNEIFVSVVRNPLDRCVSYFNYMKSRNWLEQIAFDEFWIEHLSNPNHEKNIQIAARTSTKQVNVVDINGLIFKYEELKQFENYFKIDLDLINTSTSNYVTELQLENAKPYIQKYFKDDYKAFEYDL
jgi:hypothetical protein